MAKGVRRLAIIGAAGRDFHNFNTTYRDDPATEVVAFTATQIPGIAGRRYPVELAGPRYPQGIRIVPEDDLERLIRDERIDACVFANAALTSGAALTRARNTRSLTSFPSAPSSFREPTATPNSLAMAWATTGAFSSSERSSSP